MPITPWEKIGDPATLGEGYGKRIDLQKFKDHKGRIVDFYFLERPSGSFILPITKDGNVVLVRQFKQATLTIADELPGGNATTRDEDPRDVALREFTEETGYKPEDLILLGSGDIDSRNAHAKFYCYLAKGCEKKTMPHLDDSEEIESVEVPFRDWAKKILQGDTHQWEAIVGLLWALPHLGVNLSDIIDARLSL